MGLAIQNFSSANQDALPSSVAHPRYTTAWIPMYNFNVALLPYIEQEALWRASQTPTGYVYHLWLTPVAGTPTGTLQSAVVKTFNCPSDPSLKNGMSPSYGGAYNWAGSSYAHNFLLFGSKYVYDYSVGYWASKPFCSLPAVPDGTSNTIAMTEKWSGCNSGGLTWVHPGGNQYYYATDWGQSFANPTTNLGSNNYTKPPQTQPSPFDSSNCDRTRPQTSHGAAQTLMLDGSVRGVTAGVTPGTWWLAVQPADGQPMPGDW
jgi:hypothetical protein